MLNKDYKEMLQILLEDEVRFLVVGAYALGILGHPRATGDIDIWVDASVENSEKLYRSLKKFGAPLSEISENTFCAKGFIFQIGVAPRRIDIITEIEAVEFEEAYENRLEIEIEGLKIPFISKEDIIINKLATGREKDRLDAKYLQQNE